MFYEALTWEQAMERMLGNVQNMDPRCSLCYKQYALGDVEQLATHMKRCYTARVLKLRIDQHGYKNKTVTERLKILQDVSEQVNFEISRYLIDHVDLNPAFLD